MTPFSRLNEQQYESNSSRDQFPKVSFKSCFTSNSNLLTSRCRQNFIMVFHSYLQFSIDDTSRSQERKCLSSLQNLDQTSSRLDPIPAGPTSSSCIFRGFVESQTTREHATCMDAQLLRISHFISPKRSSGSSCAVRRIKYGMYIQSRIMSRCATQSNRKRREVKYLLARVLC